MFKFVASQVINYPAQLLCHCIMVSKSGFYYWKSKPVSRRSKKNNVILFHIFQAGPFFCHVTPEAFDGDPIAIIEDGAQTTIDAEEKELSVDLSEEEIKRRLSTWKQSAPLCIRGVLAKYAKLVSSASEGAVTDK
jgi:hypothetical protein